VADQGGAAGDDLAGGLDLGVRHAEQDGVAHRRLAAAGGAVDLVAGVGERGREGRAHAAWTHDPNAGERPRRTGGGGHLRWW
jgi:hypothetical protein